MYRDRQGGGDLTPDDGFSYRIHRARERVLQLTIADVARIDEALLEAVGINSSQHMTQPQTRRYPGVIGR